MADQNHNIDINIRENGAEAARRRIDDLNNSANRAENSTRGAASGIDSIRNAAGAMGGPVGNAAGAIEGLASKMAALGSAGIAGAMVVGVGAAYAALVGLSFQTALAADDLGELADKMGITVSRLEELKVVADENSGSVEGYTKVLDKLSKSLSKLDDDNVKTAEAFAKLGLSMEELDGKSKEEQALAIVEAYEALGRSAEATAGAMTILGGGFRDQIPMIKAVGAGLDETSERLDYFGARVNENISETGGKAETALTNFGLAVTGLKNNLSEGFADPWIDFINGTNEAIRSLGIFMKLQGQLAQERFEGKGFFGKIAAVPGIIIDSANGVQPKRRQLTAAQQENSGNEDGSFDNAGNIQKGAEARVTAAKAKIQADKDAAEATKKAAAAADAAAKKAEAHAERVAKLGQDAVRDSERQLLISQKQSNEDIARYDTTQGKLKEITQAEKDRVVELARQRDEQEKQNEKVKERVAEQKKLTDEITASTKEMQKLAAAGAGRLAEVGQNALASVSLEKRSVGLGSVDRDTLRATDGVNSSAARNREELKTALGTRDDGQSLLDYQKALEAIDVQERATTEAIRQAGEERKAIQADWTNGAKNAYASYIDEANNLSAQMESVGKNIFKGMEDALTSFVTTGKLNFKSFAASILADLARIAAQKAIAGIAGALFGGTTAGASNVTPVYAKGGAFSGGTQFFASGGVVNRATGFGMANNKMGVMGEAGPEAIMPLQRGADGKLGVKMNGSSGQGVTNVFSPSITVTGSSGSQKENEELGKTITTLIERKYNEFQAKSFRPGGMNNRASLVV